MIGVDRVEGWLREASQLAKSTAFMTKDEFTELTLKVVCEVFKGDLYEERKDSNVLSEGVV